MDSREGGWTKGPGGPLRHTESAGGGHVSCRPDVISTGLLIPRDSAAVPPPGSSLMEGGRAPGVGDPVLAL
uniref:Uncharacterized protein n=1 Tax=Knipowitschia caucasica TaxID=637954 RepID=A0AAV2MDB4_KNICA